MSYVATERDRKHFCTYDQAIAAIPDKLPFQSNGYKHVALNLSTGHRIPCADAYMASGYVAGSAALFPQWSFVLEMGPERIGAFAAHSLFFERMKNSNWREAEDQIRTAEANNRLLMKHAQEPYDAVMARGLVDEE